MKIIIVKDQQVFVDDHIPELTILAGLNLYLNKGHVLYWANGMDTPLSEFIIGHVAGLMVDHIDRNSLNNQEDNLRHVTKAQNSQNRRSSKIGKWGYIGVTKAGLLFGAQIRVEGKSYWSGSHHLPIDAARAYDALALKHNSYAPTNKDLGLL